MVKHGASHLIACTLLPEGAHEGDRVRLDVGLVAPEPDAAHALAACSSGRAELGGDHAGTTLSFPDLARAKAAAERLRAARGDAPMRPGAIAL